MTYRLLVADDSATIQKVVKIALTKFKVDLREASSYHDALAAAGAEAPELLIVDANLPGATSAKKLLELSDKANGAPMIVLVGSYEATNEQTLRDLGARHVLRKPFDSAELVRLVNRALNGQLSPAAAPASDPREGKRGSSSSQNPRDWSVEPGENHGGALRVDSEVDSEFGSKVVSGEGDAQSDRPIPPPPTSSVMAKRIVTSADPLENSTTKTPSSYSPNDWSEKPSDAAQGDGKSMDLEDSSWAKGEGAFEEVGAPWGPQTDGSRRGRKAYEAMSGGNEDALPVGQAVSGNFLTQPHQQSSGTATRGSPPPPPGGHAAGRQATYLAAGDNPYNPKDTGVSRDQVRPLSPASQGPTKDEVIQLIEEVVGDELRQIVSDRVVEYCNSHFKSLAREVITEELRRLADEKARYLVDD